MNILRLPLQWTLFRALAFASAFCSVIVGLIGIFGGRPLLSSYVRDVVRGHQSTIESFFKDSISQQILVGDGPEVLRKCYMLLKEDYVRAVFIKDLSGDVVCNLKKKSDEYPFRWSKSPIFFDEEHEHLAVDIWLGFSTKAEQRLIWVVMLAAFLGTGLLFLAQLLATVPLTRRILQPLADISRSVTDKNPEQIQLPELANYRPVVHEVRSIFLALGAFLERFTQYKNQLIESTRFEAVARTVQIIAHDLKAPMASFERLTRIPEADFGRERGHLLIALRQLHAMTDAIKRAEFEEIVRKRTCDLNLATVEQFCQALADKHNKSLRCEWPSVIQNADLDEPMLARALSNLIINAIESARHDVVVTLDQNLDRLLFRIADDGPGIPPEMETKLFSRGATSGKSEGTGLGLHYVRRVAEGHGGEVTYKREGKTTLFALEIPLERQVDGTSNLMLNASAQSAVELSLSEAPKSTQTLQLLIICLEQSRLTELRRNLPDADVYLPSEAEQFSRNNYQYIICEDWELGRHLKANRQKILFESSESTEKLVIMAKRFLDLGTLR